MRESIAMPYERDIFDVTNSVIEHYAPTVLVIIAVFVILGIIAYRLHYRNRS